MPNSLSNIVSQGLVGMSIFFVLSGFILTYNYFDKPPTIQYKSYLIKRFTRIYPVYIFASLITLPWFNISLTSLTLNSNSNLLVYFGSYCILIILNIFLLQAWSPSLFNYWINGSTWSLSVECFFYLLFPYILIVFKSISYKSLKVVGIVMYLLSVVPSLIFMLPIEQKVLTAQVYSLPVYRLPECILGVIVGFIFINNRDSATKYTSFKLTFVSLFLMLSLSLFANFLPQIYVSNNFFVIPLIVLIVYYCANLSKGFIYKFLSSNSLTVLGWMSYSFYLIQSLPIFFIESNYQTLVAKFPFLSNNYLLFFFILLFNFFASFMAYYIIESPLRFLTIRKLDKFHI